MELKLIDQSGKSTANVAAADTVFGRDYNEALIHQVVTAYLANARMGTRAQKDRGEVSHTTKKPFNQKGTGRARAGMSSSPLWRGGGKVFAAVPRDFAQKVNRKMYRGAMCCILSELARQDRIVVVDSFVVDQPKTKALVQKLKGMGIENALIVSDALDENLYLSARNVASVSVCDVEAADPVSLIAHEKLIVTVGALRKFEEMLG